MNNVQPPTRLHSHMAAMLALEQAIGQQIEYLLGKVTDNQEVVSLLKDLRELTTSHRRALKARLHAVAPDAPIPNAASVASPLNGLYDEIKYPASGALVNLHTVFNQAVTGYAVLMVLARRAADSNIRGAENTDDLVQQHMHNYTAAAQNIVRLLPGMVISELEQEGQECQCSCPSCGLGICLCAISTRRMLEMAWTDAGPIYAPEGILMLRPRLGSATEQAGLEKGDVILAVDGKGIESIPMLQATVRNHKSGEEIRFQVQRESGEQAEVSVIRP